MHRRRTRTPPVYKGSVLAPSLMTPIRKLLGEDYDRFMATWQARQACINARTFHSVPVYRAYLSRTYPGTAANSHDPPHLLK